jgi:hypothetical protein
MPKAHIQETCLPNMAAGPSQPSMADHSANNMAFIVIIAAAMRKVYMTSKAWHFADVLHRRELGSTWTPWSRRCVPSRAGPLASTELTTDRGKAVRQSHTYYAEVMRGRRASAATGSGPLRDTSRLFFVGYPAIHGWLSPPRSITTS